MPSALELLKCVGKAAAKFAFKKLGGELVADVWEEWSRKRDEEAQRAEIEHLAQASSDELRRDVNAAVRSVAGDQPADVQQAVAGYLQQVPGLIRRTLRRSADPSGRTVPPGLRLHKPEDLLPFLPDRLPRFQPGDRPVPGADWELVELLGVGGFGEVWKARNPHRPQAPPVALKFCLDPEAGARLLRHEAAVLNRVMRQGRHGGIVQLLNTYLDADPPCLAYEYIEGGDLTGMIQDWHQSKGGPTPHEAARVMLQLADIVAFTHQMDPPIVHRDLKPANILVRWKGRGGYQFKIADFGIGGLAARQAIAEHTRRATTQALTLATAVRGAFTPLYASPQQVRGDPPDPRDDVHGLGVIWYQLLTGHLAAGAPSGLQWTQRLLKAGVSKEMLALLSSCFEARAEDRPRDAGALADALAPLADTGAASEPSGRHRPRSRAPAPDRAIRKPLLLALSGVLAVVTLVVTVVLVSRGGDEPAAAVARPRGPEPPGTRRVGDGPGTGQAPAATNPAAIRFVSSRGPIDPGTGPETLPGPNVVAGRRPVTPEKTVVRLDALVTDAVPAAGGQYLILYLERLDRLEVFDVKKGQVVRSLPVADANVRLAAGRDKLLVWLENRKVLQRWNLKTFDKEAEAPLNLAHPVVDMAIGSDSDGPLLVAWGRNFDRDFALLDVPSLTPLELDKDTKRFAVMGLSPRVRASANGKGFGHWSMGGTSGLSTFVLQGKEVRVYRESAVAGGHVVPGPTGDVVYTKAGRFTNQGGPLPRAQAYAPQYCLPAHTGDAFVMLLTEIGARWGGAANAAVYFDEVTPPVLLAGVDLPAALLASDRELFGGDKRVHLYPEDGLLVTIPSVSDRVVLHRLPKPPK